MATYYVDGAVGNDSNAGTSPGSGNAWATIAHALSTIAEGDIAYVKASATYSIGTGLTCSIFATATKITRIIGYTSTVTDGGKATIQATAAINGLTFTTAGNVIWENFIFDGNSATGTKGIVFNSYYGCALVNCVVQNWSAEGVDVASGANQFSLIGTKITGCAGTNGSVSVAGLAMYIFGCSVISNSKTGIYVSTTDGVVISNCLIASNTGSGINVTSGAFSGTFVVTNCVLYNNTSGSGLVLATYAMVNGIFNNIFVSNSAYGINFTGLSAAQVDMLINYNAFYNNTSGARSTNLTAGPNDVTLSGDPFTNAAGDDFSLNNTSGAGAACRAAGFPGVMVYGGTGYLDIGSLQHQDSGSGGGAILIGGALNGGMS